eukprot:3153406-Amphidinium_carterae.1
MGFASKFIAKSVAKECQNADIKYIEQVVRMAPKIAPLLFEQLVKKAILRTAGLVLRHEGPYGDITLKAQEEGQFPIATFNLHVLYAEEKDNAKSVDLVFADADTLYVVQITTAHEHDRIQGEHLKEMNFHMPQNCKQVNFLYIVPTSPSALHLTGRTITRFKFSKRKPVITLKVSARDAICDLAEDVQRRFESGQH